MCCFIRYLKCRLFRNVVSIAKYCVILYCVWEAIAHDSYVRHLTVAVSSSFHERYLYYIVCTTVEIAVEPKVVCNIKCNVRYFYCVRVSAVSFSWSCTHNRRNKSDDAHERDDPIKAGTSARLSRKTLLFIIIDEPKIKNPVPLCNLATGKRFARGLQFLSSINFHLFSYQKILRSALLNFLTVHISICKLANRFAKSHSTVSSSTALAIIAMHARYGWRIYI